MGSFVWDRHFVTGIADVDEQHQLLVNLINRLEQLLNGEDGVQVADIEAVLAKLTAYAQYHFATEEAMMESVGLDDRHVMEHKTIHCEFLKEVVRLKSIHGQQAANDLLKFLTYWLAYHILGTDQSMARQRAAILAGQSASEAYVAEDTDQPGATEPLLLALNGLFKQVSERNQQLIELNRTLEQKVQERTRSLSEANHLLEQMALFDALTGLPNRRHAMAWLSKVWTESSRTHEPLSCMMIDADGFKQINDHYGHDAGDEVLKHLAHQLRDHVRTDDVVCRLGGDEFLVICSDTALDGGLKVAHKMRAAIADLRVRVTGDGIWPGSISVGVAQKTPVMHTLEDLVRAADLGLYQAKRNGRNRVESAPA